MWFVVGVTSLPLNRRISVDLVCSSSTEDWRTYVFAFMPAVEIPRASDFIALSGNNGAPSRKEDLHIVSSATSLPRFARANPADELDTSVREIDEWLASVFGLRFDPFRYLNATEDVRLHEYMIDHEMFDVLYDDSNSFVFAPAGGGKSAFRVRLARACRVGERGRRLFPIVYLLPPNVISAPPEERWSAHKSVILQAVAFELLLRLAYHPQHLDGVAPDGQRRIRAFLDRHLPMFLDHLLNQITGAQSLVQLAQRYDPTARWPNPPDVLMLERFGKTLSRVAVPQDEFIGLDAWGACASLILEMLGFEAIYLLIDGVDAYPETFQRPAHTWELLQPVLDRMDSWAKQHVFVKAFLPSEMADSCPLTVDVIRGTICWTQEALKLLLQRRMEAASGMAPAGLSMLGDPELFDLEMRVIQAIKPYPREALRFVERMFLEHVRRKGPTGRLSVEDFQGALDWYRQSSPNPMT